MSAKRKIGIMGGTFDPIHIGHLITAEIVLSDFPLDEILFIPAGVPPHKDWRRVAKAEDRLTMVELALANNLDFGVVDIEIKREGPSYTIDTIDELRKLLGDEVDLFFITGADAINDLYRWREPHRLLTVCDFIVVTRQGVELDSLALSSSFSPAEQEHIHHLTTPHLEISSTVIRKRISSGKSIKYLVPQVVEDYIKKAGLYL